MKQISVSNTYFKVQDDTINNRINGTYMPFVSYLINFILKIDFKCHSHKSVSNSYKNNLISS